MSQLQFAGMPAAALQSSSGFKLSDLFATALPDLATLQQTLGDFIGYSQYARLLQLDVEGIVLPWLVEHWQGSEALNAPFSHELTVLLMQARLSLDDLLGRVAYLTLMQADGSMRRFSGIIDSIAQLGSDGGLARYGVRLVPATHYATLQGGSLVWQDLAVDTITDRILARYAPHVRHRWQLGSAFTARSLCVQYQETDWQFLSRLWSEAGISYYYEHSQEASSSEGSGHTLVLVDTQNTWPPHAAIVYGRISSALGDDRIDALQLHHALHTSTTTRASWDYKTLIAPAAEASDSLYPNAPALEDYSGSGAYRHSNNDDAQAQAHRAQAANRLAMQTYHGGGAVRSLAPGARFTLTEHADFVADYDYLIQALGKNASAAAPELIVLSVAHYAANNLTLGTGQDSGAAASPEHGSYRNTFSAVRPDAPIVPTRHPRPAATPQTALVTGLAEHLADAPHTERDHRLKLQFHWQRGSSPNPGGHSDQPITDTDQASGTDTSHTWVRVAEWLAGPNWGSHFMPRVGDEVLVDFIDADPDRPIVLGSVHNPEDLPPFSAGVDSGANHGGTVSGIHTRGLDGGDYARALFDDAQGQLRTQLKTGYHNSQFNAGHILNQAPHSSMRGAWRGVGFELKTDGWAVLRASMGLLLTTTARPGTGQATASTQMDSSDAISELDKAQSLAQTLTQGAAAHGIAAHNSQPLVDYTESLKQTYTSPVGGQSELKHTAHARTDTDPAERFNQPALHLDAPAPAIITTPASSVHYAAIDHTTLVQGDWQQTATATASFVAGGTLSLYNDQAAGGAGQALQIKAGNGPLSLQAHTDALELSADQSLKIISVNDEIHITAQERITLTGADSQIELNGMNITFRTPGTFKAQSGGQDNAPSQGSAGTPLGLPQRVITPLIPEADVPTLQEVYDEAFVLKEKISGMPLANTKYRIKNSSGGYEYGVTDKDGYTHLVNTRNAEELIIEVEA